MNAPWFDPHLAWIPRTALGVIGGLFGSIFGILMPISRLKKRLIAFSFLKVTYFILLGCSLAMLVTGAVAFVSGQPYGIWYGLGLSGLISTIVFGALYPLVFLLPKQIEAEWKNTDG